jgi:Tfp pilus assembly protein PilN
MIKINLTEKKKTFQAPVVLGFDFADFPLKTVIIVLIFTRVPLGYFESVLEDRTIESNEVVKRLRQEESGLRKDIRKNNKIAKELEVFNTKINDLKERGRQVDVILKTRTNPRYLLEKIARVIPKDLWLKVLKITDDKNVSLEGSADNYRSIGNFMKSLNDTAYFEKSLQLKESTTKSEMINQKNFRYEAFKISGKVESYNPFLEDDK